MVSRNLVNEKIAAIGVLSILWRPERMFRQALSPNIGESWSGKVFETLQESD